MTDPGSEQRFNHALWIAPLVAVFGFISYMTLSIRWAVLRDPPWANYALMLVGFGLAVSAVKRARGRAVRHQALSWLLLPIAPVLLFMLYSYCNEGSVLPPPQTGLVVGDAVPDLRLLDEAGVEVSLKALSEQTTLVIFFRGDWCIFCRAELAELQSNLPLFEAAGARIVGISIDPVKRNRRLVKKLGLGFRLLSDPDLKAINRFGVRHGKGRRDLPMSLPAAFLLSKGRVAWGHIADNYRVRTSPSELLERIALLPEPPIRARSSR